MFHQIDQELISKFRQQIRKGEVVALLPWGNDFIANYLAPRAGFRTFNIGGDKNLLEAYTQWPVEMLALRGELDSGKTSTAIKMLIDGTADVLVVPYFHMLWSPHLWPCLDETVATLAMEQVEKMRHIPGFVCPSRGKANLYPFIKDLKSSPYVDFIDNNLFATVRLHPDFARSANRDALINK